MTTSKNVGIDYPPVRFNYLENVYVKSNDPIEVHDLREISDLKDKCSWTNKRNRTALQMSCSGYRWSLNQSSSLDSQQWNLWNGAVFIDFDSKYYYHQHPEEIADYGTYINHFVQSVLMKDFKDTFLFAQVSSSGLSCHFVFYFDCQHTKDHFVQACSAAYDAFCISYRKYDKKADEIMATPKVMDSCGTRPTQLLSLSNYPIIINKQCTGSYVFKPVENIDVQHIKEISKISNNVLTYKDVTFNSSDENLGFTGNVSTPISCDWSHSWRLSLCIVFANYFGDDIDRASIIYDDFVDNYLVYRVEEHDSGYLKRKFRENYRYVRTYIKSGNKNYIGLNPVMLNICKVAFGMKFDYKIELNQHLLPKDDVKYDKTYELEEDQSLSNVFDEIMRLPNSVIHITAGCGLGKTTSVKKQVSISRRNTFDLFDVKSSERICFVSPMTSININNFEADINWILVDSNHKDSKKTFAKEKKSVCTTWDSFVFYEMYTLPFTVFVFDEIHSLFLYDYRLKITNRVIKAIRSLLAQKRKVIMMTGTPSVDQKMFQNAFLIKVNKKVHNIPVKINLYTKSYENYMLNDISSWRKMSDKNHVIVFYNYVNNHYKERFEKKGIKVDLVYNKNFKEDCDYVNSAQYNVKGTMLVSAYGQLGINLYTAPGEKVKVYILEENAISIIQYMNRIRNTESIEEVNVFFNREKASNSVMDYPLVSEKEMITKTLEMKRRIEKTNDLNSLDLNNNRIIRFDERVNRDIIIKDDSGDKLNEELYHLLLQIEGVKKYEQQFPIICQRLLNAQCKFSLFEVPSEEKKNMNTIPIIDGFSFCMVNFLFCRNTAINTKNGELTVSLQLDSNIKKYINVKCEQNLDMILQYLLKESQNEIGNSDMTQLVCLVDEKWKHLIAYIVSKKKKIRKTDISRLAIVCQFKNDNLNYIDIIFAYLIKGVSDEELARAASIYLCLVLVQRKRALLPQEYYYYLETTFSKMKELHSILDEYGWFMGIDNLKFEELKKAPFIDYKVDKKTYQQGVDYLIAKHKKGGCRHVSSVQAYSKDQKCEKEFQSVKEASQYYKVSTRSVLRYIKDNTFCKKAQVYFRYSSLS